MSGRDYFENSGDKGKRLGFLSVIKAIRFAITIVWGCSPALLLLVGACTILQGLGPVVNIWVSKYVLNSIVDAIESGGRTDEMIIVFQLLGIQCVCFIAFMLINKLGSYLRTYLAMKLELSMTSDVLKKISTFDLIYFENSRLYDMTTRALGESGAKPFTLINKIAELIRDGITFISMGGLIAFFSIPLFICMILLCLPYFLIKLKYGNRLYKMRYERTNNVRMAGHLSKIMVTRHYIPEIVSFNLWSFLLEKWFRLSKRFMDQDMHLTTWLFSIEAAVMTLLQLGSAVAVGYIAYVGIKMTPPLTIGEIMMYSRAFLTGMSTLGTGLDNMASLHQGSLFLHNLIEFNKIKATRAIPKTQPRILKQIDLVELRNVSFRYPGREEYALKNINLKFRKPGSMLVVGHNGAGKTTLMKLLAGLYHPTEGQILVNGCDLKEYEINSIRENIGVVFQNFIRYALSVKENIGCGCVAELENEGRIVNAARTAKADSFIQDLPLGYETILSKEFKHGQELSLGQWQRICIARLFMKNSPVLIFDEPTASLDIETEAHLLREIVQLSQNKICVLVSHRMLRKGIADQIVVMQEGKILETGTYESLVIKGGEFARLCQLYNNTEEEYLFRAYNKT